ncbi:hypothetical protein KUTeg_018675 [Tegillarca granosa]|uniref:Pyruvate kinase n=1 Tax=Tegillarca granosa TaxID=220873 RepID=A0ABQ9EII7_TEGGR|nr:hypothetical protein KUTeg_018675 [Tegillarca granosa]
MHFGGIPDKEINSRTRLLVIMKQMLDCGMLKDGDFVMVDKGQMFDCGMLKEGDCVMVNKGFNIKEIDNLGLMLIIPPNAPSEGQMSAADVRTTKK